MTWWSCPTAASSSPAAASPTPPTSTPCSSSWSKDGALDTGFGNGGKLQVDLGGPSDSFFGVALTPDGKHAIVAGYKGADPTTGDDAVLARVAIAAT